MSSSDVMAYGTNLREEMLNRANKHREAKFLWRYPAEKPPFIDDQLFVIVVKQTQGFQFQIGAYPVECPDCKIGWYWESGDDYYTPDMIDAWAVIPGFEGWGE